MFYAVALAPLAVRGGSTRTYRYYPVYLVQINVALYLMDPPPRSLALYRPQIFNIFFPIGYLPHTFPALPFNKASGQ